MCLRNCSLLEYAGVSGGIYQSVKLCVFVCITDSMDFHFTSQMNTITALNNIQPFNFFFYFI